jgi:hypothetical protein
LSALANRPLARLCSDVSGVLREGTGLPPYTKGFLHVLGGGFSLGPGHDDQGETCLCLVALGLVAKVRVAPEGLYYQEGRKDGLDELWAAFFVGQLIGDLMRQKRKEAFRAVSWPEWSR